MEPYDPARWQRLVDNGRIPRELLATIDPPDYDADLDGPAMLHPEATWNFQRMREAARAEGVVLTISYSYRTLAVQVLKYQNYVNGGNLAARPGTSNHGWAVALDLGIPPYPAANNSGAFRWLKDNAQRYGFHNNDAPSEPWHWDYEGGHPIEEDDDVTTDELVDGWRAFLKGEREPAQAGHRKAGWNMAKVATSLPKAADHEHPATDHEHPVVGTAGGG